MSNKFLDKLVELRDGQKLTWKQIAERIKDHTPNALRKSYYRYVRDGAEPKSKKSAPKVLVFDIETLPIEAYVWDLFDQNIGLEMIKEDWSVLSFSAKWLGAPEKDVMYRDTRNEKNPRNDKKVLDVIHSLLDEADIVLVQNGARFDVPKLNARFILNGMLPPSSYRIIDTLKIAKKYFGFTSKKLAYMTDKLCTKYKKLDHPEFAGFKLWKECLAGNIRAWKSMQKYNTYDILSLEELYAKMAPWDKSINFSVYSDDLTPRCNCGSSDFKPKGFHYTNTAKFQRYVCLGCGKESRDNVNLFSKEKRSSLKR